jgi:hypothetical protein
MNEILGINRTIYNDIYQCLENYGVDQSARNKLEYFLRLPPDDYLNRQKSAKESIKAILYSHGKAYLSEEIAILGEIEEHVRPLQDKLRDHVIHAVLTFLLGIYLIENFRLWDKITPFEWKLSSLLHDIAYPYEITFHLTKMIEDHINGLANSHQINTPVLKSSNSIINLEKLSRSPSSIKLLTQRFRKWGFNFSAGSLYRKMRSEHNVDHGIISSMLLLKSLDILYEHYNPKRDRKHIEANNNNWNYEIFENQIVNSCASIFIHNLPLQLFQNNKINEIRHALPFILRLSDELQDWERITKNDDYHAGTLYSININDGVLKFNVPESRLDKIRNSMSCFEGREIIISSNVA